VFELPILSPDHQIDYQIKKQTQPDTGGRGELRRRRTELERSRDRIYLSKIIKKKRKNGRLRREETKGEWEPPENEINRTQIEGYSSRIIGN
jgi:hypothetical protein